MKTDTLLIGASEQTELKLELKYEPQRRFFIRLRVEDVTDGGLPATFLNVVRKKDRVECTTMPLMKRNNKVRSEVSSYRPQLTSSRSWIHTTSVSR